VRRLGAVALTVAVSLGLAACAETEPEPEPVTVGLIIKQDENPFFVEIREVAQDTADELDAELLTAAGRSDVDNASQVAALERMSSAGAEGILITPADSRAIVPAIERARAAGVTVIALDTPTEPESAVDAVFATDNRLAGELVGRYARARAEQDELEPQIALLDLAPGITSGELRRAGFLAGFGIREGDPRVVGSVDTEGDETKGRVGMRRLLERTPGINVVYAVNEPAAFGAIAALEAAGKDADDVLLVTVDGGCQAMKEGIRAGDIDATSQQYPENMGREGVEAIVRNTRGGEPPAGYLNTGVELIAAEPAPGVDSRDEAFGTRNCWG